MGITTTVREIMTKDIVSVKTTDSVKRAIDLMVEKDIGSVVVAEGEKLVGILTERDILKRVCPEDLCSKGVKVGEIMSKPLITIEANARLGEAALLMTERNIRRLLVVEKGEVLGIITQKDLLKGTLETFMALTMIR